MTMQRILQPLVVIVTATLVFSGALAAEMHYGVSFEPVVAADGAVSVVIHNLSKVPVTLRGLTVGIPGGAPCAGAAEPITVGPGRAVSRTVTTCRAPTDRRFLTPLSEAVGQASVAPRPTSLTLAATLDRLGQSHEVKAGWSAAAP
jgi:hypothetical protein